MDREFSDPIIQFHKKFEREGQIRFLDKFRADFIFKIVPHTWTNYNGPDRMGATKKMCTFFFNF